MTLGATTRRLQGIRTTTGKAHAAEAIQALRLAGAERTTKLRTAYVRCARACWHLALAAG